MAEVYEETKAQIGRVQIVMNLKCDAHHSILLCPIQKIAFSLPVSFSSVEERPSRMSFSMATFVFLVVKEYLNSYQKFWYLNLDERNLVLQ